MVIAWSALACMAVAYGIANFLQAVAATRDGGRERLDPGLLVRLARQKAYLAALAFQAIGTVTSFLARRELPLFLVQAAIGAGLVVTALLGVGYLGWRMPRSEIALIVVVLLGVTTLIISAEPGPAKNPSTLGVVLLGVSVLVLAFLAHLVARAHSSGRWASGAAGSVALGALAGSAFGFAAIASRPLVNAESWSEFLTDPLLAIVILHTIAGQLFFGMALQRGSATAAAASMNAMAAIPPALIGLAFLGDHIRDGLRPLAALGFFVTIAATGALAWYAQPQSNKRRTPADSSDAPAPSGVPS